MDPFLIWLDRIVESLLGLLLGALVLIGACQVAWRFLLNDPLSWTIEASILLLIWATMLSGYIGVRRGTHLSADFLGVAFGPRTRWWFELTALVSSGVFTAVYGWTSREIIDAMGGIPYTSLPLNQDVAYLSLPVSAGLMLVAIADRVWRHVADGEARP